jgi:valyl-tRNA synthetase
MALQRRWAGPIPTSPIIKRYFPTSVLVTGYDIIFFWVSRMIFNRSISPASAL